MSKRGFYGVGLSNVKNNINIANALRACGCYSSNFITISGDRYRPIKADTQRAYRHIPTYERAHVLDSVPMDCEVVAVDLVDGATPLHKFIHPERAFYVFGPEDGTLGQDILDRARYKVYILTKHCLNLAMTVNTVLYDRQAKYLSSERARPTRTRAMV